jgi:hypothetical protein
VRVRPVRAQFVPIAHQPCGRQPPRGLNVHQLRLWRASLPTQFKSVCDPTVKVHASAALLAVPVNQKTRSRTKGDHWIPSARVTIRRTKRRPQHPNRLRLKRMYPQPVIQLIRLWPAWVSKAPSPRTNLRRQNQSSRPSWVPTTGIRKKNVKPASKFPRKFRPNRN